MFVQLISNNRYTVIFSVASDVVDVCKMRFCCKFHLHSHITFWDCTSCIYFGWNWVCFIFVKHFLVLWILQGWGLDNLYPPRFPTLNRSYRHLFFISVCSPPPPTTRILLVTKICWVTKETLCVIEAFTQERLNCSSTA